jgi:type II secretory pathway pseudopilin PulG
VAIVVAVALLAVGITAIVKSIQNNSPEGKLEAAKKAAEQAANAADNASTSYQELSDSFDLLENKYKTLENLTKGTKEWN